MMDATDNIPPVNHVAAVARGPLRLHLSLPQPLLQSTLIAASLLQSLPSRDGFHPSSNDHPAHNYRLADLRLPYERFIQSSLVSRPWRGELSLRSS
jgi:hypothetical protein